MPPAGRNLFEKRFLHFQKLLFRILKPLTGSFGRSRNTFSKGFLVFFLQDFGSKFVIINDVTTEETIFSDDHVVRSVREGNTRNFEILIDRYKKKIINFIYRMIFDYDEAQSLAQDAFLKVYESIPNYESRENFQAFIYTVAKNITLNYIKKQKRVQFFSSFLPGKTEENVFRTESTQHAVMEKDGQEQMMLAALKELNENQRLALILKVYLDFSYNRIADITGWSVPKIETLISRAKGKLKEHIHSRLNLDIQENVQEKKKKNVLLERVI